MSATAYVDNDNLIWIRGAKKARDGTIISSGIGQLTNVRDPDGTSVTGQTFPTLLLYTGADGDWVGQLDDTLDLAPNQIYYAVVDLDAGSGLKGHWEVPFMARVRRA